jgi:5-methylthioadenosine/S-adenosylhomocysteine deaminase
LQEGVSGLSLGDASLSLADLEFAENQEAKPNTFHLRGFNVHTSNKAAGDNINSLLAIRTDQMKLEDVQYGPGVFELEFRNLDAASIAKLQKMLGEVDTQPQQQQSEEATEMLNLAKYGEILAGLLRKSPEIEILYRRHYHEYDTYFSFQDPSQGYLRYREDEFIDDKGQISNVRYRLTLLGPAREFQFPSDVLLSRSRFIAPATHSLRFYREYFKPVGEASIEKDRLRWRVLYQGTEFYINLDNVLQPSLGYFLEVKSRTWSKKDAEHKAQVANHLLAFLSASSANTISQDYIEIVKNLS